MNSRVSWSVDGIDPSVRERAEAAARRAGMSLSDWLNSTIGETPRRISATPSEAAAGDAEPGKPRRRRHPPAARLDHPADRTDFAPRAAQRRAPRRTRRAASPTVARQLNDAISRLDARLSQISNPAPPPADDAGKAAPDRDGRARRSAGLSPFAAAEPGVVRFGDRRNRRAPERTRCAAPADAAAQRAADGAERPAWRLCAADAAARACAAPAHAAGPDFSSLERHLLKITSQIESLQRPDHIEQSIAAFRSELAEIRHAITEAMPRRAIEFDRERNPLAVAPHRRNPPERHRRPGAGRHRARARRNLRGAALAEAGRAARRL